MINILIRFERGTSQSSKCLTGTTTSTTSSSTTYPSPSTTLRTRRSTGSSSGSRTCSGWYRVRTSKQFCHRADRNSQVLKCLVFLFSWFIGWCRPKISCKKPQTLSILGLLGISVSSGNSANMYSIQGCWIHWQVRDLRTSLPLAGMWPTLMTWGKIFEIRFLKFVYSSTKTSAVQINLNIGFMMSLHLNFDLIW